MGPEAVEAVVMGLLVALMSTSVGLILLRRRYRTLERRFWALVDHVGLPASVVRGDLPPAGIDGIRNPMHRDQRLETLENRFEQLVDQIDRLAESQDFLARVMVDRGVQLSDPGMRTPH